MKLELSSLQLGDLSVEDFLTQYWQKKPLLIRNALPGFTNPISPDELAGLACEEAIESRLVIEKSGSPAWEVRHGPFAQQDFESLPENHWNLVLRHISIDGFRATLTHQYKAQFAGNG
jgi:50S ribosomal protein L16 3-hydroxylase